MNIYQNGTTLDLNKLDATTQNWETTWYSETYVSSTWSSPTTLQSTMALSSADSWKYDYNFSNHIADDANGSTIPLRIRGLITTGTTQIYSQWYYIGG